jgi:fucose permease
VIIFVYLLYAIANAAYSVAFAPIATLISKTYDISTFYVNLIYGGTSAGYLLFAIPANWCIENKGVHFTIIISSIVTLIGIWIRILVN